jgi:hypothetical protein
VVNQFNESSHSIAPLKPGRCRGSSMGNVLV